MGPGGKIPKVYIQYILYWAWHIISVISTFKCMYLGTDDETKNPGGARFGNFINYYEFNPPQERLSHLPQVLC